VKRVLVTPLPAVAAPSRIGSGDNGLQHIPQKFDAGDVAAALASRDIRMAELAALKGQPALPTGA
jgi:hypothetical protein